MKKNVSKLIVVIFTVFILCLFLKVNTNIFIGDYSNNCCKIDVQIKIDNKQILNDSLSCNPLTGNYRLKEMLKYGLHKIYIHSNRANVSQTEMIFLLPYQYISIEFFPSDTLCLEERIRAEEIYPYPKSSTQTNGDSLGLNTTKIIINERSRFFIESRFNPFYME